MAVLARGRAKEGNRSFTFWPRFLMRAPRGPPPTAAAAMSAAETPRTSEATSEARCSAESEGNPPRSIPTWRKPAEAKRCASIELRSAVGWQSGD